MENKIVSIQEKVPAPATLPNGYYIGNWGGYTISVSYKDREYVLRTEEGVRGVGIKVVVYIEDSNFSFECTLN